MISKKRKGRYLFRSDEAVRFLGTTPRTFRKYRDALEIRPRKIYQHSGRYYTWMELLWILDLMAPRADTWVRSLPERLKLLRESNKDNGKEE